MYANNLIAVSGLLALVAAVPMAHEQHNHLHQPHNARDYVWVTETEEAIVTIPVTQTVWLEPGETAPSEHQSNEQNNRPAFTSPAVASSQAPSSSSSAPAPYVPPTTSSTSQYVAPTSSSSSSVYAAPSSSSSAYVPPSAPTSSSSTSVYTPPPPSTTSSTSQYTPPTPTTSSSSSSSSTSQAYSAPPSSAPAPSSSSAPQAGGSSVQPVSNHVSGMAASGSSFTGQLTHYSVGMGSCGIESTEDQIVVALSHVIMSTYNGGNPNNNPLCGKTIGIKAVDGTVHHATIVDTCPGCDEGSLDLPLAFFNTVSNNADGVCKGVEWSFD